MRTTYKVTVSYPTNFHQGCHEITVHEQCGCLGVKFCSGKGFGCSRDYQTNDDKEATRLFLRGLGESFATDQVTGGRA